MIKEIICGDALNVLRQMPDAFVDCCVTSPPYFGLRDYGVDGQIGIEKTPNDYIACLVEVFREVRRTLKDDGTLWVNIADSYAGGRGCDRPKQRSNKGACDMPRSVVPQGCKTKDLIGIPWALAFALRADGWFLRQDIIWQKPNAMPESVTDRCTKSHEYIFLLSKAQRYYFDHEAIKEPRVGGNDRPVAGSEGAIGGKQSRRRGSGNKERKQRPCADQLELGAQAGSIPYSGEAEMRNRRDVWTVATKPLKEAHFATYPPELVLPCVSAGSRPGGIVLDPFSGSGTTALVAQNEGRGYIGIDLNPAYCELAQRRIADAVKHRLLHAEKYDPKEAPRDLRTSAFAPPTTGGSRGSA